MALTQPSVTTSSQTLSMYCIPCTKDIIEKATLNQKRLTHAAVLVRLLSIIILLFVAMSRTCRKYDVFFHYLPSVV